MLIKMPALAWKNLRQLAAIGLRRGPPYWQAKLAKNSRQLPTANRQQAAVCTGVEQWQKLGWMNGATILGWTAVESLSIFYIYFFCLAFFPALRRQMNENVKPNCGHFGLPDWLDNWSMHSGRKWKFHLLIVWSFGGRMKIWRLYLS